MKIPSRKHCYLCFLIITNSLVSTAFADEADLLAAQQNEAQETIDLPNQNNIAKKTEYDINVLALGYLENYAAKQKEKGFRSEIKLGNIDPLLSKRKCEHEPNISFTRLPEQSENITATISCRTPQVWKLYLNSEFKLYGPVVTASSPIPKGIVLDESYFEIVERQTNTQRAAYYSTTSDLVGMVSKRPIRQGQALSPKHVTPPKLIERGDLVTIVAHNDKIRVKMQGIAMKDGKKGQQISIKNNHSNRIVKAYVENKGLVSIRL